MTSHRSQDRSQDRSHRTGRLAAAVSAAALTLTLTPYAAAVAAPPAPAPATSASRVVPGDGIREGQLDRLLRQVRTSGAIGVTAELVTPDGTWRGAAGRAELDPDRPATEDASFRAASVSKQLVAVLALQLVQDGRWTLDTTLGDVLPELWPEKSQVTLRQLLSHTGGLPEYLLPLLGTDPSTAAFQQVISQPRTDHELVGLARTQPDPVPAGQFSYANTNYVVLGMMLERATGRSTGDLVRERVLAPARMSRSDWPTTRAVSRPHLEEHGRLYGEVEDLTGFDPSMFSSAGRLVSTARDLDRFQLALSTGRLISPELLETMRTPVSDGGVTGLQYGLGSYRLPDPCQPGAWVHGHDGGSWGTLTLSYASPDGDRRVAVSMTGRDYDGNLESATALKELAVTALAQTCGGVPRQPSGAGTTTTPAG